MIQKLLRFIILFNTILFFILYSVLNLDIQNKDLEGSMYSIFKKEELETVRLVNIKNTFYYKIILTEAVDFVKLDRELNKINK